MAPGSAILSASGEVSLVFDGERWWWVMVPGRVMALDVGKVRVGVALSDPLGYTAQPLLTLWRKSRGEDLRSLLRLIRKHEVVAIVVGNPLHMSGDVSPWAAKVQAFAAELGARSGLPVELWDERLSSVAAHEILDEAGHDRRDRKQVIDQVAAVVILRGWMEAKQEAASRAAGESEAAN
jgi:putative holliday junction resolvase